VENIDVVEVKADDRGVTLGMFHAEWRPAKEPVLIEELDGRRQ
jgi:hypothetical protein